MDMRIDKNKVYELAFKTIKDSLDMVDDFEEKGGYSNYIYGVASLADKFVDEIYKKIPTIN